VNGSEGIAMAEDHDWDEVLIKKVPRLAELLRETGAEEIEIGDGDRMVRVRRSIGVSSTELLDDSEAKPAVAGSTVDDAVMNIESEQVGVFMAVAEGSESTATVVGDEVEEGQVIGFVDVLGVAHEVSSPVGGVIDEMLVHDGSVVEFGQRLVRIRRVAASN
jgi:acetyl-CoA carboxylase biotin carboxyl carrier protein